MKYNKLPLESQIQRKLIKQYESEGYMVVKINLCNKPGFPDLMLLKAGVASFIEVKRAGQNPRPLQMFRIQQLRERGFEVNVISG